jgi:hypothetical protein
VPIPADATADFDGYPSVAQTFGLGLRTMDGQGRRAPSGYKPPDPHRYSRSDPSA